MHQLQCLLVKICHVTSAVVTNVAVTVARCRDIQRIYDMTLHLGYGKNFCLRLSVEWSAMCFMPNTHRRRDSTVELSRVGGVY